MHENERPEEELRDELTALRQRVAHLEQADAERQRLTASLRESEEKWRTVVQNVPDFITTLDEQGPLCVHELVDRLGASQPLVSQHLRVLRGADVVRGVRRGKEIAYEIADAHVAHIVADALRHTGETPAPALRGEATA